MDEQTGRFRFIATRTTIVGEVELGKASGDEKTVAPVPQTVPPLQNIKDLLWGIFDNSEVRKYALVVTLISAGLTYGIYKIIATKSEEPLVPQTPTNAASTTEDNTQKNSFWTNVKPSEPK